MFALIRAFQVRRVVGWFARGAALCFKGNPCLLKRCAALSACAGCSGAPLACRAQC